MRAVCNWEIYMEWINIKYLTPLLKDDKIIVYTKGKETLFADIDEDDNGLILLIPYRESISLDDITHWMRFPKIPKEFRK